MSADHYAICPKCIADDTKEILAEQEAVHAAYGKVSEEEWLAMKHRAKRTPINVSNLAEYFEVSIKPDGTFFVNYKCKCSICGFEWKYEYSKKIKI